MSGTKVKKPEREGTGHRSLRNGGNEVDKGSASEEVFHDSTATRTESQRLRDRVMLGYRGDRNGIEQVSCSPCSPPIWSDLTDALFS